MPPEASPNAVRGTLIDVFRQRVQDAPDACAFQVIGGDSQWHAVTRAAFADRVERLATALSAAGIIIGDRVGICAPTSLDWEVAQMASLTIGASIVGLETGYSDELLAGLMARLNLAALIVQNAAALKRIPESMRDGLKLTLTIDPAGTAKRTAPSLVQFAAAAGKSFGARTLPRPEDEAMVAFSSGTTGSPRPVCYCHGQVSLALDSILEAYSDVREGSTLVCWLPLANLFQRMINLAAMARGAITYIVEDPRTVMDHVGVAKPDVLIGVPRFFERVHAGVIGRIDASPRFRARLAHWALGVGQRRASALHGAARPTLQDRMLWPVADRWVLRRIRASFGPNLRYFISGSAPMPHWLLDWFEGIGLPVLEAYGVSEDIVPIAANNCRARRSGTVGRPLPGQIVQIGTDGEIQVSGPGVALGEPGPARSDLAGWSKSRVLATGDLGELDEDGFLRITGRQTEVFKTPGGTWVAPAELESRLRRLTYIEHAVAVGAARSSIVALVWVTTDWFEALAREPEADGRPPATAAAEGRGRLGRLRDDVATALADLPGHQHPACLLVFGAEGFSVASGELTTNLKVRRRHVEAKFARAIDDAFIAIDEAMAHGRAQFPLILVERAGSPP